MKNVGRASLQVGLAAAVVGGAVAVAGAPAYAAGSNLDVSGSTIYYTADSGVTNNVTITRSGDTYLFVETGGDPIASSDRACSYPVAGDTTRMQCVAAGITAIWVSVGDLNDTIAHKTDRVAYLYGGSGNDTISMGGSAGVTSYAYGGIGNDKITSGAGDDVISGSSGTDTVVYTGPTPVTASLLTNTATRGTETDTFSGIENLTGGTGSDTLIGNNASNVLDGGSALLCSGNPLVCAQVSGDDTLFGLGGEDTMYGRAGNDWMWGGDADDTLDGGTGDDHLFGDAHTIYNTLYGGPGNDECVNGEEADCEYGA